MDRPDYKKRVNEKRKDFKKYSFLNDAMESLVILHDLGRESNDAYDIFSYSAETLLQYFQLNSNHFILSEDTNRFYKFSSDDSILSDDPYHFISKEMTSKLIRGEYVSGRSLHGEDENYILLPLKGKDTIKAKTGYPKNRQIIVGAMEITHKGHVNTLLLEKYANRLGTAYHHSYEDEHVSNLNDHIALMLGIASHDLKSLADVIGGMLESQGKHINKLADYLKDKGDKTGLELLDTVNDRNRRSAKDAKRLSRDFNDYLISAQVNDTDTVSLNCSEFNIYENIFKEIEEEFAERAKAKNITLDTSLKGIPSDVIVYGDVPKLRSVFRGLVSNAIKYGEPGGKAALGYEDHTGEKRFIMWNSGPHIPKKERHDLFKKWRRLDKNKNDEPGTGLGLYNIKKIVEAHDGGIWYDDRKSGPTFVVSLPLKDYAQK